MSSIEGVNKTEAVLSSKEAMTKISQVVEGCVYHVYSASKSMKMIVEIVRDFDNQFKPKDKKIV